MLHFYTSSKFTSCSFILQDHVILHPLSYSDASLLQIVTYEVTPPKHQLDNIKLLFQL